MNKNIITSFLLLFMFSSCHEYYYDSGYPCDYCYTEIQTEGLLTIQLSINDENPLVPILIFEGELETNDTIWADTTDESNYEIFVPVDKSYTVIAEYKAGDKTIKAVDYDKITMNKNTSDCDDDCWVVLDAKVDVSLKYTE